MRLSLTKTLFIEILKGASLSRILTNNRLRGIKLGGKILNLGVENISTSYFRFLEIDKNSEIVSVDMVEKRKPDLKINLENPLPLRDNEFDCILCFNLLEHIFNYEQLLKELHRILKENGKFLGSVPFLINIHPDPNDYFRYTQSTLKRLFEEAGFRKIKIEPIGYGPFSASYSLIAFVFPRIVRPIILLIVIAGDNLLVKAKKRLNKRKFPLAYYFECKK